MTDLSPVIVRIVLRYLSGALVAWGLLAPESVPGLIADPDLNAVLVAAVGGVLAALTEWAYARARREGGPT